MPPNGNILRHILADPSQVQVEHIIDVMLQVSHALRYLHVRHLIHSDLKPDYIYVAAPKHGGYVQVKLGRLGRCQRMIKRPVDTEGIVMNPRPVPLDSLRC